MKVLLIVLGAPIWLSLLISAFAVAISVVVSLWAVFVALAASALGGVVGALWCLFTGYAATALAFFAAALVCCGLSILMFYVCIQASKGIAWLCKKIFSGV